MFFLNFIFNTPGSWKKTLNPGIYIFECYGGKGGDSFSNGAIGAAGGNGSFTQGSITFLNRTIIFLTVGGKGTELKAGGQAGGYNGGGMAGKDTDWFAKNDGPGSGGGASEIRYQNNVTKDRIMVAAGGSGACGKCGGASGGNRISFIKNSECKEVMGPSNQTFGDFSGIGKSGEDHSTIPGSGGGGGLTGGRGGIGISKIANSGLGVGESGTSYISGWGPVPHPRIQFTDKTITMISGASTGWKNDGSVNVTTVVDVPNCENAKLVSNVFECINCSSSAYLFKKSCVFACPAGTYKDISKRTCELCPVGTANSNTGVSKCQKCESNTYSSNLGQKTCDVCSAPGYGVNIDHTSCDPCSQGSYKDTTMLKCELCPVGTANSNTGVSECPKCESNTYSSNLGQTTCDVCSAPGHGVNINHTSCDPCSQGSYKDTTMLKCELCPVGTANSNTGVSECQKCESNTYSSNLGQTTCDVCSAPGHGVDLDHTKCDPCSRGTFGEDGICQNCTAFTFSNVTGATKCERCEPGTYSEVGASECKPISNPFTQKNPFRFETYFLIMSLIILLETDLEL